jgi:ribulose-phosphate 3-epimerase
MTTYQIAASILSADFANLGQDVIEVLQAGADWIHFDVMDNHYVPNLTIGPLVCQALRNYGIKAPIDVHLMTQPVDRLIEDFAKAGATYISIHCDTKENLKSSLKLIHTLGCKAGLVFNPSIPLDCLSECIDIVDLVVLMSVNPGFAGQKFIAEVLPKIIAARQLIEKHNPEILLEIDGGVKLENVKKVALAGANVLVMGSALFDSDNYQTTIESIRKELIL